MNVKEYFEDNHDTFIDDSIENRMKARDDLRFVLEQLYAARFCKGDVNYPALIKAILKRFDIE